MRTAVVTGAAGFIGSHTTRALLPRFDKVIGLDNLNDYYDPARKRANIETIQHSLGALESFEFVEGDIRDADLVIELFARQGVSVVVHLAAMAGVWVSIERPTLYYDVNVMGTLNVLNAARDKSVANVVLASTSVYGRTNVVPFVEAHTCDGPLSPYAASKRASELMAFTYHHLFGMNVTALRFFTVYGPSGRPDMMAYEVLSNIFAGTEVPIYNSGQIHRDWTYINDIVSGIVAAAERPLGFEIINLGRGEPVLLADFVKTIEAVTGKTANLTPAPMPDTDVPFTFADTSKARALLGYDPGRCHWFGIRGAPARGHPGRLRLRCGRLGCRSGQGAKCRRWALVHCRCLGRRRCRFATIRPPESLDRLLSSIPRFPLEIEAVLAA